MGVCVLSSHLSLCLVSIQQRYYGGAGGGGGGGLSGSLCTDKLVDQSEAAPETFLANGEIWKSGRNLPDNQEFGGGASIVSLPPPPLQVARER